MDKLSDRLSAHISQLEAQPSYGWTVALINDLKEAVTVVASEQN